MHRFFIEQNTIVNNTAYLTQDDSAHAARVLRLSVGDKVVVCDCAGNDYDAKITSVSKDSVCIELSGKRPTETEPSIDVTLIQCLPKTGKMEVIIQKCVELGVKDVIPVSSDRCVVKVDKKSAVSKLDRYNKVSYEAAKQSQRGIIPKIRDFCELSKVDLSEFDVVIIPYEEEQNTTLKQFVDSCKLLSEKHTKVAIIIGPEGGFEKSEVEYIIGKGGASITLGKRILRTETAGMATLAMLMGMLEQ